MADYVLARKICPNPWTVLRLNEGEDPKTVAISPGPVLLPLSVWQSQRSQCAGRAPETLGIWLEPDAAVAKLVAEFPWVSVLAVDFPKPGDGRGYSLATQLRRLGWQKELRAICPPGALGNLGRDFAHNLEQVGFDAFDIGDARALVQGFDAFRNPYQGTVTQPQPLFRRHTIS